MGSVFAAIMACASLANAADDDALRGTTLYYSRPKVSLDFVRFVYNQNRCELSADFEYVRTLLQKLCPDADVDRTDGEEIDPACVERLYGLLEINPAAPGPILMLESKSVVTSRMTSIVHADSAAYYYGLAGVLELPLSNRTGGHADRPIALIFPTIRELKLNWGHVRDIPVSGSPLDMQSFPESKGMELASLSAFFEDIPLAKGYIGTLKKDDGQIFVFVMQNMGGAFRFVPFPNPEFSEPPFELVNGALSYNDTTPKDSTIHVLPDLDGNGQAEILIVSTGTALYSIERYQNEAPRMKSARFFYNGL